MILRHSTLVAFCYLVVCVCEIAGSGDPRVALVRSVEMRVAFEVREELPQGTFVGRIPTKPGFTYRFNEHLEEFRLNASTGEIRTGKVIDRETLASDRFDLVVLSSTPTYPVEVRITVLDLNDHAPAWLMPDEVVNVSFSESSTPGTRIFLDTAEDPDSGVNGVTTDYRIVDGNEEEHFRLAVTTNPSGEAPFLHLETTGRLDRETKAFYSLNISAQDGGNPPKFGYLLVQVSVVDTNDNSPIFHHSDYVVSLNESVPMGTAVLQVMATDNDDGDNAKITYYLAESETQFSVDPETGVISTMQPSLNCQQNCPQQQLSCSKSCVFTVYARDHGYPRQDGRAYITVNLLDANVHDPILKFRYFPPTASAATVDENAVNGSVVAAISVLDMDEGLNGETVVRIISGNDLKHFRLESTPSFQLLRVNGVLDREKISKYNLSIIATDKGSPPRSSTSFLLIQVNDINDHAPIFEQSEYSAVLRELVPIGSYVASILAKDEDTGINSEVFYSVVSGNEQNWFQIDSETGLLTTKAKLDRETQDVVRLKISARDGGPNPKWAYTQIKISLLDENEPPTFEMDKLDVALPEDSPPGSLIANLVASDSDQGTNGTVSYHLGLETEDLFPELFHLDSSSGALLSKARFDRELRSAYEVIVVARDHGSPSLSSSMTVQLLISDVNEDPVVYPTHMFTTMLKNAPLNTEVGRVQAVDLDQGLNATLTFQLQRQEGVSDYFLVDNLTGVIRLKKSLTSVRSPLLSVQVLVRDGGGRQAKENFRLEVLVMSSSSEETVIGFTEQVYTFSVQEDEGKLVEGSREIGQVKVKAVAGKGPVQGDPDFRYSIVSGDSAGVFHIGNQGSIQAVKLLDREVNAAYNLSILLRHGSSSYGKCIVQVKVDDVNDHAPAFERKILTAILDEDAGVGSDVVQVSAVDLDFAQNGEVTYSLLQNPNGLLSIDPQNGLLTLNKPLYQILPASGLMFVVRAQDGGTPPLTSEQSVLLQIRDVNNFTPVFTSSAYEVSLLESTPVNTRFFALQATDEDMGENAELFFAITDGNESGKFGIFPDGHLFIKSMLDREKQDYFSLTVLVQDSSRSQPRRSSTASLVVHVIDDNDHQPRFHNSSFTFFLSENEGPDTFVGKLSATDEDIGRNAELTYSISSDQNEFTVDPKTGFVTTLKSFDREELLESTGQDFISLEVVVEDGGSVRLKDTAQMRVYIEDVNDHKPRFQYAAPALRKMYTAQISEAAPVGSQVIRILAFDMDEGLNGDIIYYFPQNSDADSDDEPTFKIDQTTGQVTLARTLDRETISEYLLTVVAQDLAPLNPLNSTTTLRIELLDENDNEPEFVQSEPFISASEATSVNTELIQFLAVDPDLGLNQQVWLSITGGNRHDTFRIDPKTGSLYLNKLLDYEKQSMYTLNITASDSGNPRLSSSIQFVVKVEDRNDNAPVFSSTAIVRQVQEGIAIKTPIVTVLADDPDSGLNGKVKYSITEQEPPGDHFEVDADRGIIFTVKEIDREFTDSFRLTVTATDQAIPVASRLSAEKLVTIIVEDINDNEPAYVCMNSAVIRKDTRVSTEILKIRALDPDSESNGVVTYEMTSGDSSLFALNRNTGSLTLRRPLTDLQPRYQLSIRASDEAIQSQRKSSDLFLTILGVEPLDETQKPVLIFERTSYRDSIPENEPVGTSILSVRATIQEGQGYSGKGDIEYYITNITSRSGEVQERLFDMDVRRGVLSTATVVDREMGVWSFLIEIRAIVLSSEGLHTARVEAEVEILDRNDFKPQFSKRKQHLNISESTPVGQEITKLVATDQDSIGNISYSFVKDDYGKFRLDEQTGTLSILDPLDREVKESYELVVRASDGVQHSDLTLLIQVLDENDCSPRWSSDKDPLSLSGGGVYSFDVPEDAPHGYSVGGLNAFDPDEGVNGVLTYSVLSDWGNDVFSLNPQTGIFTLASRLDYEDVQHYIFVVQAQDSGVPSLSSTATVYVNVIDLNDNAPVYDFDSMSYNREIYENSSIGTTVVTVSATDMDSGLNGKITYAITAGNTDESFEVSENGTISTIKSLDREKIPSFILTVEASDHGVPKLSSSVQVSIVLKDVNDCSPVFITPNETSVMENSAMNTIVLVVKATDEDDGRNGYVEYSLSNERSTFSLGPVDGFLRVNGIIDRESKQNFSLEVTARDRGDPSRLSHQILLVRVLDVNDNNPVFDPREYSAAIPENSSVGMSVLQVTATDIDEGVNQQIRYTILSGDPNRDFVIGEDSGVIRLSKNLHFERKRSYTLMVQAEDSGDHANPGAATATVSISVVKVRNCSPVFLHSPYAAQVRENLVDLPVSVLQVSAFDEDASPTQQIRYLIKDGDKGSFRVNASTGEITLHRVLDRELQSEYQLTVVAMDTGTPRLTGTGMIRILVSDDNDNAPRWDKAADVFSDNRFHFSVKEQSPIGSLVAKIRATDPDQGLNSKIRYKLSSGGPFAIDEDSGVIVTTEEIDYQEQRVYHLVVTASDSNPINEHSISANVTIRVESSRTSAAVFKQFQAVDGYSVTIPDGAGTGTYVFGFPTSDIQSGTESKIRYYLGGQDADKFQISQSTGVIKTLRHVRAAANRVFELEIHATDSSFKEPVSSMVNVQVHVTDSNKFPRITKGRTEFSYKENSRNMLVTTIEALPAPNKAGGSSNSSGLRFKIGGGNLGNAFEVDQKTGQVRISSSGLDFEVASVYELWVAVTSEDEPKLASAVSLHINVTDENDCAPTFSKAVNEVTVLEEEPAPKYITTLVALDQDSGINGKVRYRWSRESESELGSLFGVDAESGEVYAKMKLDREERDQYALTVQAVDMGTPPQTGTASVLVLVGDKNDNPSRFTRLFNVNVTENVPIGTFVIQVTSVDKDIGENANCSYTFTENPGNKFIIDPISGNVTVSGMLDRETQDEYLLRVAAIDGSWRAETLVTITIQDENDCSPEYEESYYSFNIPEGNQQVAFVGQVTASDEDKRGPNSLVTYQLKHPSDFFTVDPVSGEIFSKKRLVYKLSKKKSSPENQYSLDIIATDSGKPPMSSEASVTVNVLDCNKHAPKFSQSAYFSSVLENMSIGDKVMRIEAEDILDFGINAEIEYATIGGNGSKLFGIDKETGWVQVNSELQGRRLQRFEMQIRAVDKGIPPQSAEATLVLAVTGANLHAPTFSALSYRVIVPENEGLGSVIVTVTATDADTGPNGQIIYSCTSGNEAGKFRIDRMSGAVSIVQELDYELRKEYNLSISARDMAYHSLSSEAKLTILLTDINDNAPTFSKTLYEGRIKEMAALDTPVIQMSASDKDSHKFSIVHYGIVGGSGKGLFHINQTTGLITSQQVFDFEEQREYFLEIVAANPDSNQFGSTRVRVLVEGVNEFLPRFVQPAFHFTISESASIGSYVGSVEATDEDAGSDGIVYYFFVGSSNDRGFSINSKTGSITISRRLDRESQSRVVLTVLAKNAGSIRGNDIDEAQIIITVQDGNDPPVFEQDEYKVNISEGMPPGSKLLTVKATDIDIRPSNNQFSYEILKGNPNKAFRIDPLTGSIYTTESLDREAEATHTLTIGAVDIGEPPQTGTTVVHVTVLDKNDNGPVLTSTQGSIYENEPPNTKIMTLTASDADLPPNGQPFIYTVVGGSGMTRIKVDPKTGQVTSSISFDREATPELKFVVEIQDSGTPPLKSRQEVTVVIEDKNDCASEPRNGLIMLYNFKTNIPKEKVASVEPIDPDTLGKYSCHLEKSPDQVFSIPADCDLFMEKPSSNKRHSLKIMGEDGRHPAVVSTMTVELATLDNNTLDNAVVLRLTGDTNPRKVLMRSYAKLLSYFRQIFRSEPHVFSLVENENATDLMFAVGSGSQYEDPNNVVNLLSGHKNTLEGLLEATVTVNYSPCSARHTCQNGGSCTQFLRAYSGRKITESPLLILSSPVIQHEFSCKCPAGFDGDKCQLRKEPCLPSPCEAGGTCSKLGYDFQCTCPPHRHGKRCEIERQAACEVNPCKNGAECKSQGSSYFCLCRPGFFGRYCQVSANDACRPNPCLNGGECVGSAAFPKCKCLPQFYGQYCEKSGYGFAYGSYMTFSPLDSSTNDIAITFSTNKEHSLLVYNFGEQTGGRSDFVALELVGGKPTLSFGGARTAVAVVSVDKYVTTGGWFRIMAVRNSRVISLGVSECGENGESCKECRPDDPSCYADNVGPTGTLSFNGNPVYVGGLKNVSVLLERPGQIHTDDFIGCIHSLEINGRASNISSPLESRGVSETCQRSPTICDPGNHQCGAHGKCIDLWDSYTCRCSDITAPNCEDALAPYTFRAGAFLEFRTGERYSREQLLQNLYINYREPKQGTAISAKSISFSFRTVQNDGVLLYAASNKDFTMLELENGHLKFSTRIGSNYPINMSISDLDLADRTWHNVKLLLHNHALQLYIDGEKKGEDLDAASSHDFMDPYLTSIMLGGITQESLEPNRLIFTFEGCMANFSINGKLQPFNDSGSLLDELIQHGKVTYGCSGSIMAGTTSAPDPLSIGVTLVIVFFVILLVAILVSFVVFRMRKREKTPLPSLPSSATKPVPSSQTDVVRNHVLDNTTESMRNFARNSKKTSDSPVGFQKPDIIERTSLGTSHNISKGSSMNTSMSSVNHGVSMEPDLPELPEHYDLENASSIAPSDIDIVYHYKGYRDTVGGRSKSSPFRHSHHFSGSRQSPGIRQSPISSVLKSTPLARLSPSSELSQQTAPRILTLQDISGKPLQSALLATAHQKDAMSQSERSLNISQSSTRSSIVNASRQGTKKRKQCGGESSSNMTIGLTAEEIERLNSSRHKNNSSLVSTLDAVSSSDSDDRMKSKLSNLREVSQDIQRVHGDSSSEESGNDSFTCSEFEYDNEKRDDFQQRQPRHRMFPLPQVDNPEGNGSRSTLVASDDDLAYINGYRKGPQPSEEPSTEGWNYLMNWGPNYSPLSSVFKNISELPTGSRGPTAPPHPPQGSGLNNLGTSRNSRYPTPRPSEEYV